MHIVSSMPWPQKNHGRLATLAGFLWLALSAALSAALIAADAPLPAPADLAGAWDGEVTLAGKAVHIRLDLQATPASATLASATPAAPEAPPAPSAPAASTKTTVKSTTTREDADTGANVHPVAPAQPAPVLALTWTGSLYARQDLNGHPLEKIQFAGTTFACETLVDGKRLRFQGNLTGRVLAGAVLFLDAAGATAQTAAFRVAGPPALANVPAATAAKPGATFEGDWEGAVRPAGAAVNAAGTPLWITLVKTGPNWQGTLYIKSREPGTTFDKITINGNRFHGEATLDGRPVVLEAVLADAKLQGDLTVRAPAGAADGTGEQHAAWNAAPAARSGFAPRPIEPVGPGENPATPRPLAPETGLPVFPGAQGFGARTPAGRGGRLIEVTTLDDSGPGSLREALTAKGPRTIVFRVGGVIATQDFLYISEPFVTVAGETAPGDGICIVNAGLVVTTHDVLLSHLRIRPGNQGKITPSHNDALCILGDHQDPAGGAHHIVVDHLSAGWSEDECVSVWGGAREITFSWCLIGEALSKARHHKDTHSAGLLVGDSSDHVSMHHNLLAHNGFRNPLISLGGTHEFVNNVVYDWQDGAAEIFDLKSNTFFNFIGNTYLSGPSTQTPARTLVAIAGRDKGSPRIFAADNQDPQHTADVIRANDKDDAWRSVGADWQGGPADVKLRAPAPFTTRGLKAEPAGKASAAVLAGVGALRPRRDSVDARLVNEVKNRTGKVIDSPADVGGLPAYRTTAAADAPLDSDHDGMPDTWETVHALDPRNPADGVKDRNQDGYTNLEEFLHSLR
ncbi:MAG TPA: hypothetical protein VL860_08920 [Planctomycetota bacterium]|nr:hypothetical protein [Planctomycetota bacterium]